MPRISVLMPVYNQERFVGEAVASVLSQTCEDLELIVVDDGSVDRTRDVVASFDSDRIRLIAADHRGFLPALQLAMSHARGRWGARMDADDLMRPHRLDRQSAFLETSAAVLVASTYGLITPAPRYLAPRISFELHRLAPSDITHASVPFADPSAMFDLDLARACGYDERWENEKPLWYRLLDRGDGYVFGEPLVWVRYRLGSHSRGQVDQGAVNDAIRSAYDVEFEPTSAAEAAPSLGSQRLRHAKRAAAVFHAAGDRMAVASTILASLRAPASVGARLRTAAACAAPVRGELRIAGASFTRVSRPW